MREYLSWEPLIGYFSYAIGAIFFNWNTAMGFVPIQNAEEDMFVAWGPAVIGSILFSLGGSLEIFHNWDKVKICKVRDPVYWISVFNCFGGWMFLLAATCGFAGVTYANYQWLVNFPYVIGSFSFLFGSMTALFLWKSENYGLGLLSELNVKR